MRLCFLSTLLLSLVRAEEECYKVTCETLQGKCSEKSDLESKILLSDDCDQDFEYCHVNNEEQYSGVCKTKNYFLEPQKLFPEDPCAAMQLDKFCAYGKQKCSSGKC
jgi:hypothetical protein